MVAFKDGVVVGGITYRPYYPQRYAEIAFCAVIANEQVKVIYKALLSIFFLPRFSSPLLSLTHLVRYFIISPSPRATVHD
jgi:hypothetical protein